MLDEKALNAITKLEELAKAELARHNQSFHDENYRLLAHVPNWASFVKANHANPHAKSGVEGCLNNLRSVTKRFNFKLD